METVICYYHNDDLDGVTSAAVVKKKYPNADFFGWNYGEHLEVHLNYDIVFIVDITLPENVMKDLIANNKKVIWIDHHGRKIKDMEKKIGNIAGLRDTENEYSACILTWKYLFSCEPPPTLLRYVEDLDLWKWEYGNTDPITTSLWITYGKNPQSYVNLLNKTIWNIQQSNHLTKGKLFIKQRKAIVNEILTKAKIDTFKGYKTAFINAAIFQSSVGNEALKRFDIDIALIWNLDTDFVRCSLRSNKNVDVSKIAKQLNGGGHPRASGFQCTLPELQVLMND